MPFVKIEVTREGINSWKTGRGVSGIKCSRVMKEDSLAITAALESDYFPGIYEGDVEF